MVISQNADTGQYTGKLMGKGQELKNFLTKIVASF